MPAAVAGEFQRLAETTSSTPDDKHDWEFLDGDLYKFEQAATSCLQEPVVVDELVAYLRGRQSKTPGEDGVTLGMVKALGPEAMQMLADAATELFQRQAFPEDMRTAVLVPLFKLLHGTEEQHQQVTNYRPIALQSALIKLIMGVWVKRIEEAQGGDHVSAEQAGWQSGKSCHSCLRKFLNARSQADIRARHGRKGPALRLLSRYSQSVRFPAPRSAGEGVAATEGTPGRCRSGGRGDARCSCVDKTYCPSLRTRTTWCS